MQADMPSSAPNAPSLPVHILNQTICIVVFSSLLPFLLVYTTLRHLRPSWRAYSTWSLQRELGVAAGRLYFACSTYLGLPRPQGKAAWHTKKLIHRMVGKGTGVQVVEIPPANNQFVSGMLAVASDIVKPAKVPGFMTYPTSLGYSKGDEPARPSERVILYVPGGSWVMGHPMGTPFPYRFCTTAQQRVFAVHHRKCLSPDAAFPAPLQDLLAGYLYLLGLGFRPSNITLIGDSSGGHLVLGLSRYLSEIVSKEVSIGMPGALVLISPSVNLSHPPHPSIATDYLVPYLNNRAYPSMARHYPEDALATNPYFSPAVAGSLEYLSHAQRDSGLKIFVQYSSGELIYEDQKIFLQKMRSEGVEFEVDLVEGGAHLDAGLAFALLERGPSSSWVRLLDAVKRISA